MEDVEFSVTVVTIQEIIQQLCDFDSKLMQDYLDKIEVELNKDNSEIDNLKNDVITLLLKQKEEIKSDTTEIKSDTTEIKSDTTDIKSGIAEIKESIEKQHKPGFSEISLASNLPPCPPASKLYKRTDENEIFAEIPKHKLSCIAGMAGVGKSTLAITYGHHRKVKHQAKVDISDPLNVQNFFLI